MFDSQKTAQEAKFEEKRSELVHSIRRDKRLENINKRRNLNLDFEGFADKITHLPDFPSLSQANLLEETLKLKDLLQSSEVEMTKSGMEGIRKILCQFDPPPIQLIIDTNLVPKIFELAFQNQELTIKVQACWTIANLCSGTHEQCKYLVSNGVIPLLMECLKTIYPDNLRQVIWALANLAADSQEIIKLCLEAGIVEKLVPIFEIEDAALQRQLVWMVANLLRSRTKPKYENFKAFLPVLCSFARKPLIVDDFDAISQTMWAISLLTQKASQARNQLMKLNLLPDALHILTSNQEEATYIGTLRIIGNLAADDFHLTEYVIRSGALPVIEAMLDDHSINVVKEACWILSNICAGDPSQSKIIFQNEYLMLKLLNYMETKHITVKRQIGWILSNIARICDPELIYSFFKSRNIIRHFIGFLDYLEDEKTLEIGLAGIRNIFELANNFRVNGKNPLVQEYKSEVYPILDKLQDSPHKSVCKLAYDILGEFFEDQ